MKLQYNGEYVYELVMEKTLKLKEEISWNKNRELTTIYSESELIPTDW